MSTKKGFWRWALVSATVAVLAGPANAFLINDPPSVTTNTTAGLVVFPKLVVDTSAGLDTHVQLTNTANFLTKVLCFYVNANGHCSNDPTQVCTQENFREVCPAGGLCIDGWQETDFLLTLTKRQPVSWNASSGNRLLAGDLTNQFPLPPVTGDPAEQTNQGSLVPPVPEDPFIGELRCIQVDISSEDPIDRNDLKGEASIISVTLENGQRVDVSKYNAIGIPAIEGAQDGNPNVLNIGGPEAEYNACPNIWTINHFFDNATVTTHNGTVEGTVTSRLTVVPCSADFLLQTQNLASATLQFLIYNEFEQRFSTSIRITCFKDVQLSDIDTRPGNNGENMFSIFSAGVQGTLTGQSRMRSVAGPNSANGVLAVLEEFHSVGGDTWRAAANIQHQGTREQGDVITIP